MENIRIQDDLYMHVNQEWLEKAVIPDDKPLTGGFGELAVGVEKVLIQDFKDMIKSGNYPNEYLRKASIIFSKAMDTKKRNRAGFKPALKGLAKLDKLADVKGLNRKLKEFLIEEYDLPFGITVFEDMKEATINKLYLTAPSTILPDASYYQEQMAPQHDAILGIWKNMASAVLKYTALSEADQALYLEDAIKFDSVVATLVKTSLEKSEYTKMYNPMKTSRVASLLKPLKFKKLLKDLYGDVPEIIIVTEPRFLKGFSTLFNEETFIQWKHWAYVRQAIGACGYLSEELRDLGTSYRRALSGIKVMPSPEKFAYNLASHFYSEPVGLYYGEKYFGEEAKKDIVDMVHQIIDMYKVRVKANDFLAEATKEKAILKLSTMKVKMGYPDSVEDIYDELVFDESKSLYAILGELSKIKCLQNLNELNKPVNKARWAMPGNMVNACYNPTANDITFPAAILQAPFYSVKQSRSTNLGGIGAVIGHEISHAFDNNGAKVDENGNLNNWWTKEDNKKFVQKTKAMIKQFDGIELPWGKANGELIVSENIADNGGMAVTLNIMKNTPNANYEEYFINWAKVWCLKAKTEYLQLLLNVDVHAPAMLRANIQPRNFPEWYSTFNVTKKDKMFIPESKRIIIW